MTNDCSYVVDHTPCKQALRRSGGSSVHGGVRDEDEHVYLGEREEEEVEKENYY